MADDRQYLRIENETLQVLLQALNRGNRITALRLEPDGALRTYGLFIGQTITNNLERPVALEEDRTLRGQVLLWDYTGAAQIRAAGEAATGQAEVSLYGKDEALVLDALRTDPNRIPWTRPYDGYVQVDPVEIPVAEGILWNPGAVAAQLYEVSFNVVNNDVGNAVVNVTVGVDIAAGGALAAPEYWMYNEPIPAAGSSGWRTFLMAGDDDVRGVASAANDASIHFRIRRVDVGA